MDTNKLNSFCDLIWSTLNTIENENKSKEEQIELIKPIILKVLIEQQDVGFNQALNFFEKLIKDLKG